MVKRISIVFLLAAFIATVGQPLGALATNVPDDVPADDLPAARYVADFVEADDAASYDLPEVDSVFASTWASADYLHWWTRGTRVPALATTSNANVMQIDAGVLGEPGTRILFGNGDIADQARSGLRVNAGRWLDECRQWGVEAIYFSVLNDDATDGFFSETAGGVGSGLPILARPFFDVTIGQENARLSSFPDVADGSLMITSSSELHSAEVLLRRRVREGCRGRLDLIGGYRYLRFREGLRIHEQFISTAPTGPTIPGTSIDAFDSIVTANDFHGGELGFALTVAGDRWDLELLAKCALGNIHRDVTIDGATTTVTPPPNATTSTGVGGLLALTSNIGHATFDDLGVLPEAGINLSFRCNQHLRLRAGYTVLALNNVARTGDQIDREINPHLIPGGTGAGPAKPAPLRGHVTDFWAQGINFGIAGEF